MSIWLLDTGPLVAYLNRRDPYHETVCRQLDAVTGQLVTSSAVISETMYFVGNGRDGPSLVAEFVGANRIRVHGSERAVELRAAAALMRRYDNVPMDYADATLLLLSDRLALDGILTLDRRGFSVYRTPAGRALELVLRLD